MPYLQPYKGRTTRHTCPACGRLQSFTLYLDSYTHQPINSRVGKCNREIKCGYHYPPRQYFMDNPCAESSNPLYKAATKADYHENPQKRQTGEYIPLHFLIKSRSQQSHFVAFLMNNFPEDKIKTVCAKYYLGATKKQEIIFWQVDTYGKIRTGKIMQYNPHTGKRIKHQSNAINWVHNKLKQTNLLPNDFHLSQCFFGEHLLTIFPVATVAIVESEKTAVIAAVLLPDYVWLAAGSLNGLSVDKCRVLYGRSVILFPDQGAYDKWLTKANEIENNLNTTFKLSGVLENHSIVDNNSNGLDIADYLLHNIN